MCSYLTCSLPPADPAVVWPVAQTGRVDVGGWVERRFEPVREVFARMLAVGGSGGSYAGASTVGGYAFSFVTGTMGSHSRTTAVENTFCAGLGLPPLDD